MATPPAVTYWPLRQSLSIEIKRLILTQAIPAINGDLAARMLSTDPANIPVFDDSNIIIGDIPVPSGPTLCILATARRNREIATGTILVTLSTQIALKTAFVADNAPEDFAFLINLLEDNLEDLFTSLVNRTITPIHPVTNAPLLPHGVSFSECMSLGSNVTKNRVKADDHVTEYAGWMMMHRAQVNIALSRSGVVGSI